MGSLFRRQKRDRQGRLQESKVWWVKWYRDGRPFRESSGSTRKADAEKLLRRREGQLSRGLIITAKTDRITLSELSKDVISDYRIQGRRTVKDIERRFKMHILPFFGWKRLAVTITAADIRKFIVERQNAGASNAEINRELSALKRAYSLGIQSALITMRPHIQGIREDNIRKGFFEPEQYKSVLKHLSPIHQGIVTLAFETGWRTKSELLPLQWRQIDFKAGRITLDPGKTKNREGRLFPFTNEIRRVLEERMAARDTLKRERGIICPWVFWSGSGKQIKSFYKVWRTACTKAGCPGMLLHDFRRTAVRNFVRAGIPERVAMQLTGHKTRLVFDRYHVVSERDLEIASGCLDSIQLKSITATNP